MVLFYMAITLRPLALGRHLNFAAGATKRLCQALLAPHDLSLSQWVILSPLWRGATPTITDLAAFSGNNTPATSRIVDRMVERGLLTRTADPEDRRTVRVGLTDKGQALSHLATFFEQVNANLTQGFTQAETETLFDLLARVENNARRATTATLAPPHPQD